MLFLILLLIKKFNRNFGKYFWWNPAAPEGMLNFWTIPNQPPMSIPVPCSACVVISGYRLLWYLTSAGGKDLSNRTEWELFSQPGQKKIAHNLLYGFLSPPKNCMHIISRGWVISKLILLSPVQTDATLSANNSQHCWMLHVESVSTPYCMLLDVVACWCARFETSQTFQPTTPNISFVPWSPKRHTTMLDPFAQLFQHCWGHTLLITHSLQWLMGCVLPKMHCRSQHCWELLHPFAHHCQHEWNNSQHCWRNNVGSCCVCLHAALTFSQWKWIKHSVSLCYTRP